MTSERPTITTSYADGRVEAREMTDDEFATFQDNLAKARADDERIAQEAAKRPDKYEVQLARLRDAGYTDDEIKDLITLIRQVPQA
jgi:hypothetical protein